MPETRGCADVARCADEPENELQHYVFAVQGQKGPEEAQGHHAELQETRQPRLY